MRNRYQGIISAVYNRVPDRGGGREYNGFVDYSVKFKTILYQP